MDIGNIGLARPSASIAAGVGSCVSGRDGGETGFKEGIMIVAF